MKTIIMILFAAAALLSGCAANVVRGSGRVVTESRSVSNFNAVALAGAGELTIVQGGTEALTIEAEDNLMTYIKTEVRGGTLSISADNNASTIFLPTKPIRYNLSVKNLRSVNLSGAGHIRSAILKSDQFNIEISGVGGVVIDHIEATNVTSTLSGVGGLTVSGQVTNQTVRLSGLGNYEAPDLNSQSARVDISGAGGATIWARESLDVTTSGAGHVNYYGSPRLQQSKSGAGKVNNLGNK